MRCCLLQHTKPLVCKTTDEATFSNTKGNLLVGQNKLAISQLATLALLLLQT
jgi:hypothetical protein